MKTSRRLSLRLVLLQASPWILAGVTGIVLASNIPSFDVIEAYWVQLALYCVLTALSLSTSVLLSQGELSPAHMIGVVAFLSLPMPALPALTWAIFIGGCVGVLLRILLRLEVRQRRAINLRSDTFLVARVTLSFWAAGQIYIAANGALPLGRLPENIRDLALPLAIHGLVYITLYFSIFILQLYSDGHAVTQVLRNDFARILVVLLLPMPFSLLGAEIFSELAIPSQVIFVAGLVLIMLGLYALSLSEHRLRKQLEEMKTLSVVTQAMRSHLDLETLPRTIYIQVAQLLSIDSFVMALYNFDERRLAFPLVIRQGKETQQAAIDGYDVAEDKTLIGHVLKTERWLLIEDNVEDMLTSLRLGAQDRGMESWLGVPLLAGGRCLGVLSVVSFDPDHRFNRDDLRLLNIVAASSSIAIENAQLYRQQTAHAEQLVMLNRVASLLSGTLSPDKVLDTVISSGSVISGANAIAVYLFWDDSHVTLPLVRSAGLSEKFQIDFPDVISFANRREDTRRLFPVVIGDIRLDKHADLLRPLLLGENKLALIELPLEIGDSTIGVLAFYYDLPQVFSGDKIELLKTFVNQASQAINNARTFASTDEAFQRSVEQVLRLASIGRLLASTVDLQNICDLVIEQVALATKVDVGLVGLQDDVLGAFRVVSQIGITGDVGFADTLAQKVMQQRTAERVDDIRKRNGLKLFVDTSLSSLVVPILRASYVVGVIALESERIGAFSEEDSHFISQVANQAIIAIDNAQLFDSITEARDRLRVLLDAMEEGIILIDEMGRVALANPRIDLIGIEQKQLLDNNLIDLAAKDELKIIELAGFSSADDVRDLVAGLSDNEPKMYSPVNYVIQGTHGVLHIRRQITLVRGKEGQVIGCLLVFYNKTEERELAHSREEMSRMIVHDLRSPLTAVTTSLKLLQDLVPKDAAFYSLVMSTTDASRRAIRKLLSRVDSLLDVARMESGQLNLDTDLTDLQVLVDNVRGELLPLADELDIKIESQIPKTMPPLDIDGDKVERLILNLVDNALKYSPRDSTITVRCYAPGTHGAAAGYVRVEVADQGPGIPADYKHSLFDRFVQIEGRRKVRRGVGLGLSFCRLVTEAHGGKIWIEDNAGGGSVFIVTLPVANLTRLEGD